MPSYSLNIGPLTNRINLSTNSLDGIPKFSRGPLKKGEFEINGIRFPVDPQNISIYEENFNHKIETLRTRESTKIRSGHSRITISVQALFTGVSVGHDGDNNASHSLTELNRTLFPILYSLKRTPLCFIDNELLRRNLPIVSFEDPQGNLTGENIGAFIKMVNIGTVPGMPHTISAEFQFVWYNHRPFCPTIRFRKEWIDREGKVNELAAKYSESARSNASDPTVKTQIKESRVAAEAIEPHLGRLDFINNYGHPSRAFNATTYFTHTLNITESEPLIQYLWPRISLEMGVEGLKEYAKEVLTELPEFKMNSFDQTLEFGFYRVRAPSEEVLNEIYNITGANRAESLAKEKAVAKKAGGSAVKTGNRRTGPLSQEDVRNWARELKVHEDVLLAAIMIYSEQPGGTINERNFIINSLFNNALRTNRSAWDYAVGSGNITGGQKGPRKYATSKIPYGKTLDLHIQEVLFALTTRKVDGSTRSDVALFIHPESMVPPEYVERVRKDEMKVSDIPIGERYAYADDITSKWQSNGAQLLWTDQFDPYKVRFLKERKRVGSSAEVKAQAEELLRGPVARESKKLQDHTDINLEDAPEIIAEELGVDANTDLKQNIKKAEGLSEGRKANLSAIVDLAEQNWTLRKNAITGKVALVNEVALKIPEGNKSIIPLSINVGFGTNLAMTPLEGHRFPTVQYIGGQHTAATISLRCEGEVGRRFLSDLKTMVNYSEESAIHFREFTKRRGVRISNELLNGIGMSTAIIEDIAVDTVPGNPEGLTVTIRLIDSTVNESVDPVLLGKSDVSLDDIIFEAMKLILDKEWIQFKNVKHVIRGDHRLQLRQRATVGSITDRLRKFDEKFGLANLSDALNRANARAVVIAARDQVKTARSLRIVQEDSSVPEIERKAADIARYIRVEKEIIAKDNTRILPAGSFDVEVTKAAMQTPIYADLEQFAEQLERGETVFKISLEDLINGSDINLNGMVSFKDYKGYKGASIDSSKSVQIAIAGAILGTKDQPGLMHDVRFRAELNRLTSKLIGIMGVPSGGNPAPDKDFAKLAMMMGDLLEVVPSHDAYPDLRLPPNPITGLTADTTPDFFLYNDSDVKMSNSNLMTLLFGSGAENLPKREGLREALAAIEFTAQGVRQIYGTVNPSTGGVQPAHKGKDDFYSTFNDGEHETKSKKGVLKREEPDKAGALIEGSGTKEIKMETNLSQRLSKSGYSREKGIAFHLQNSVHRSEYDGVTPENLNKLVHVYSTDEYKRVFAEFESKYESEHYAVRRSFPTFKVFFIEESGEISANTDSKIAAKLTKAVALDDFYGVNSIKEIRIVKNKMHAADTCLISLLDLDGVLYNRNYLDSESTFGLRTTKSKQKRNPFLDTVIKEGMKVVVKFGYSNDSNDLETVFVGQIVGWEGSKVIDIICQSYGSELVSQRFGTDPSQNADFWNVATSDLLHDMLDREEVRHFGRWELKDIDITGKLFGSEKLRPDGQIKKVWSWKPSAVDDNLFIPDFDTYADGFDKFFGNLEYVLFDTTIWDVFKEMELRHPGYIAYPVPYGNGSDVRMTMFFGNPAMEYLSRPAGNIEEIEAEVASNNINTIAMRKNLIKLGDSLWKWREGNRSPTGRDQQSFAEAIEVLIDPSALKGDHQEPIVSGPPSAPIVYIPRGAATLERLAQESGVDIDDLRLVQPHARKMFERLKDLSVPFAGGKSPYDRIPSEVLWRATMLFQDGRMKTFRNYELVTSSHDIISNNIRCDHRDTFNSVELRYSSDEVDLGDFAQGSDVETLTITADDNIKEHHIRRTIESWPNCTTETLARRYASQLMANSLKRIYKGELIIMGRASLKPYDFIWLYDNYSDMSGPVEVEEVVHTFSSETGFITEVVPNMIVSVKEEVMTITSDAMAAFFTEHLKEFTSGALTGLGLGAAGLLSKSLITGGIAAGVGASATAPGIATGAGAVTAATGIGGAGATLAVGGAAVSEELANSEFDRDNRPGTVAGLVTGAAATGLWMVNPLIPCVSGIIAGWMLYKVLKYNATREPILVTPLIKQGKPFVTGLETMESDGLLITDMFSKDKADATYEAFIGRKWRYFSDGFTEAGTVIEQGWANWMSR